MLKPELKDRTLSSLLTMKRIPGPRVVFSIVVELACDGNKGPVEAIARTTGDNQGRPAWPKGRAAFNGEHGPREQEQVLPHIGAMWKWEGRGTRAHKSLRETPS